MMKRLVLFLVSIFVFSAVSAQTDEYSVLFNRLMNATGGSSFAQQNMTEFMIGSMLENVQISEEEKQESVKLIRDVVLEWSKTEFLPALEKEYRKYFTLDDLKSLVEFYESELGHKYVAKQSKAMMDVLSNSEIQKSLVMGIALHGIANDAEK